MDEAETKTCTNCKREIPAVNFTIHTVHCARNIKICPVCKEPVPQAELQEHHEKMHKLLPCKKCGESVCGTDLEDHIRDSCAHTIKTCRFCELELPRRELPAHEGYCGARTEQCAECREWVMIKYRALHKDSNHGFLRLDDDPVPQPKKEPPPRTPLPIDGGLPRDRFLNAPSTSSANTNGLVKNTNVTQDRPRIDASRPRPISSAEPTASGSRLEPQRLPVKRTNDQPQINTNAAVMEKVNKSLNISRGAVKKRQAPVPPANPRRDFAYYSALQRQQTEEKGRQEQTAINLAQGLPPVLSPAAKLERLRKMDALHNREAEPPRPQPPRPLQPPQPLQPPPPPQDLRHEFRDIKPMNPEEFMRRFQSLQVSGPDNRGSRSNGSSQSNGDAGSRSNAESQNNRDRSEASNSRVADRFSEIKSSLMALRRGLNEVTAPYNSWTDVDTNNSRFRGPDLMPGMVAPISDSDSGSGSRSGSGSEVRLPCEFCSRPILLDDLVIHQTGCRPDLAQLKARDRSPAARQQRRQQRQQRQQHQQRQHLNRLSPNLDDLPVIPCEFCTESLPVYLISDHQERCRRDGPLMYPD